MNNFKYSNNNKRYHTLDYYYKNKFNSKVFKVSLNAGFTCPNKDGTKGIGGCIYCSKLGSGDFGGNPKEDLTTQFIKGKKMMEDKWPNSKIIGYFQANTNTYADVKELKEKYEEILKQKDVIGLSIATRPDAISKECLNYLEELNKKTYLTIELGLQTTKEETSNWINRGHTLKEFDDMVKELRKRNIEVVVHIINGLPNESKEDMLNTIKHINKLDIQGVKFHMLCVLKDTKLADVYKNEPFYILNRDEYIDILINQLELLRPEIVIHRICADPDPKDLIEPSWVIKKFVVMNELDKEMVKRDTYQGKYAN